MARTSSRLIRLLALLSARDSWQATELADRLEVSTRTLRRDIETLRELDYPVRAIRGIGGGYRFGTGSSLPPLVFDTDQAVAVAVALQTAPTVVAGIDESLGSALEVVRQAMSRRLRTEIDAFRVTSMPNSWEFGTPPLPAAQLRSVGRAVHAQELLRFDYARPDGSFVEPGQTDFEPPLRVEPHSLVVWAGRWYLVGRPVDAERIAVYRVDRMRPKDPTGVRVDRPPIPGGDLTEFLRETWDRGDTLAPWPCIGSAVLPFPAALVARWAPGGSVVEPVDDTSSRLRLGAWSWQAVAGLLATYACPLADVEPAELRKACATVASNLTATT